MMNDVELQWENEKKDIWVREMPTMDYVINVDNNTIDYYKQNDI